MPPRLPPRLLQQQTPCPCFRSRPFASPEPHSARQFHGSTCNATRLRRDMYGWLTGAGKAFRKPLPGSSNYMSAYDKQGNLLRVKFQQDGRQTEQDGQGGASELSEEEIQRQEEAEGLTEEQRDLNAADRAAKKAADEDREARNGIPRERQSDLRPYPLNQSFRSQPVLSEELREQIYHQVVERRQDMEGVAASFSVDLRRVAAVVRLKTIEKRWLKEGKPLAKPYSEAVLAMLPQTPFQPESSNPITPHETINDLPVHPHTRQQIFYPTSESRHFTREDAAKVFDDKLLPADKRIPLPALIKLEKMTLEGLGRRERLEILREDDLKEKEAQAEKERKRAEWEARTQRVVPGRRWDFKFQDFSAEKVGKDGRGYDAVGYRYGMAHEDRKRGQVKIPSRVE